MTYTPKTEEQLVKEGLLPEGTYDFEVVETSDQPSKKGNAMFMLRLRVFSTEGMPWHINDYITLNNNFGERKLRSAAQACGLIDVYASGKLTDRDFLYKSGKLVLRIQEGTDDFPLPKNSVVKYLPRDDDDDDPGKPMKSSKEIIDDEIPF